MRNAKLDESKAGIRIAGRITNNLRADDQELLDESEEDLRRILIKVKEETERPV